MKRYAQIFFLILVSTLTCNSLSVHAAMEPAEEKKKADFTETIIENSEKTFSLYKNDADQGDPAAQNNLGYCYEHGIGVKKDGKKAFYWYEQAALQKNVTAQNNLGNCYLNGIGVGKDEEKAVTYFKNASDQKYAPGQYNLGRCFLYGKGVDKDEKKAAKLYQLAAEQNLPEAQYALGNLYRHGTGVEQKDEKKASEWYAAAAKQGHPMAQYNLGMCYLLAIGVNKDIAKAQELFKNANNNPHLKNSTLSMPYKRLIDQLANLPECPICAEPMTLAARQDHPEDELSYVTCCSRVFHTQCLKKWLQPQPKVRKWWQFLLTDEPNEEIKKTCPFCRAQNPKIESLYDVNK